MTHQMNSHKSNVYNVFADANELDLLGFLTFEKDCTVYWRPTGTQRAVNLTNINEIVEKVKAGRLDLRGEPLRNENA